MNYEERRKKISFKDVMVSKKEISFAWLVTFLSGGIVNFAIIIWMTAIVYNRVGINMQDIIDLRVREAIITEVLSAHSIELKRQAEVDTAFAQRIQTNEGKIQSLDQRLYELKKQAK